MKEEERDMRQTVSFEDWISRKVRKEETKMTSG